MIRAMSGLVLAVVLLFGAPALAQPVGTFNVQGQDYQGTVTVTQTGATFNVAWTLGNERYRGLGMFMNGVLSVGYTGQGRSGLAIYRENAGAWEGTWAFIGEQEVHTERWTR